MRGARVVERKWEETVPDGEMHFRWAATVVTQTPEGFKQRSVISCTGVPGEEKKRGGQRWRRQVLPEGGRASTLFEGSLGCLDQRGSVSAAMAASLCLASCVRVARKMHGWELRLSGWSGFLTRVCEPSLLASLLWLPLIKMTRVPIRIRDTVSVIKVGVITAFVVC